MKTQSLLVSLHYSNNSNKTSIIKREQMDTYFPFSSLMPVSSLTSPLPFFRSSASSFSHNFTLSSESGIHFMAPLFQSLITCVACSLFAIQGDMIYHVG